MNDVPASVWLLEDSPMAAAMTQQVLHGDEFVLEWFTDGEMLLEQLGRRRPAILILDARLPGISGMEVCTFVRERFDELTLPVLFLTAHESQADVVDVLASGANDYVRKPYDAAELRARVRTLVRLARAHERREQAERRTAAGEQRLRELFVKAPAAIALWRGPEHVFSFVNERYAKLVGRDDLLGQTLRQAFPVSKPLAEVFDHVYATGIPYYASEYAASFARRSDGEGEVFLDFNLVATRDEGGAIDGVMTVSAEVTDVVRARQGEREARLLAERSNRAKDEFLSTVSHELRTPLNAILGWARMLSEDTTRKRLPEGATQRGLETIERNALAQAELIEDLLDVSRITTGKLRLDLQPIPLQSVVEAAMESVRPAAIAKGVKLDSMLDPRARAMGDASRLQQVVWNLLSNAIKFTPPDGRVSVHLHRVQSCVELSVIDTGQGIRADFLPHVFERFEQEDATSTRVHGGLGLGLAICRHLVDLHGGTIHASSAGEGKGATFTVKLPVAAIDALDAAQAPPPKTNASVPVARPSEPARPATPASPVTGLKVLVLDDEPDARELVVFILNERGAAATAVATADEAIDALGRGDWDVLLADIGMPGQDGYAFIRRLRKLPNERGGRIPAGVLTAYAGPEDRKRALDAGYQMHVAKPVEPAEIVAVVAALAECSTI